jgi:hypothetical protein
MMLTLDAQKVTQLARNSDLQRIDFVSKVS